MNAAAIIIIAIAATGVLMMRFRKRWLAKINIAFTNRITGLFAGWLPGFGKPARSDPSDFGAPAAATKAASLHHHECLVRPGVCSDGPDTNLLRNQGRDPLVYAIPSLSTSGICD